MPADESSSHSPRSPDQPGSARLAEPSAHGRPPAQSPARSWRGTLVQIAGFALCLGILAWCITLIAGDQTRKEQLLKLWNASWPQLGMLAVLSAGVICSTGMFFRTMLAQHTRISASDAIATNSLCTLLGNLPLKISLVTRIWIHRTRHNVPLITLLSYLAACAFLILATLSGPILAVVILGNITPTWTVLSVAISICAVLVLWLCARSEHRTGALWRVFGKCLGIVPFVGTKLNTFLQSEKATHLRDGIVMLSDPSTVLRATLWRVCTIAFSTAQFALTAAVLDLPLSWPQAALAGVIYFFLQGAAPTGALGAREGGTVAAMHALIGADVLVLVLSVSAVETGVNIILGGLSALKLRTWKLANTAANPRENTLQTPS